MSCHCARAGWVQQISIEGLLRAAPGDSVILLETRVGAFVVQGQPLVTAWPRSRDRFEPEEIDRPGQRHPARDLRRYQPRHARKTSTSGSRRITRRRAEGALAWHSTIQRQRSRPSCGWRLYCATCSRLASLTRFILLEESGRPGAASLGSRRGEYIRHAFGRYPHRRRRAAGGRSSACCAPRSHAREPWPRTNSAVSTKIVGSAGSGGDRRRLRGNGT